MQALAKRRQQRKDEWETTSPETLVVDSKLVLNAHSLGECVGMKWVQEIDLETLQGELDDE